MHRDNFSFIMLIADMLKIITMLIWWHDAGNLFGSWYAHIFS